MVDQVVDSSRIGERCPYCRTPWTMDDASQCPDCSTVSHRECWIENGGCPVMGCASAPADVVLGGGPARPWGSQHMHGQTAGDAGIGQPAPQTFYGAPAIPVVQPVQPAPYVQPDEPAQPVAPVPSAEWEPSAEAVSPTVSADPSPVDPGSEQPFWSAVDGADADDFQDDTRPREIDPSMPAGTGLPADDPGQAWVSDQPLTVDVESTETPWYVEAVAEPTSVEAGWYPDPQSVNQYRWWDGSAWTETTYPM